MLIDFLSTIDFGYDGIALTIGLELGGIKRKQHALIHRQVSKTIIFRQFCSRNNFPLFHVDNHQLTLRQRKVIFVAHSHSHSTGQIDLVRRTPAASPELFAIMNRDRCRSIFTNNDGPITKYTCQVKIVVFTLFPHFLTGEQIQAYQIRTFCWRVNNVITRNDRGRRSPLII